MNPAPDVSWNFGWPNLFAIDGPREETWRVADASTGCNRDQVCMIKQKGWQDG